MKINNIFLLVARLLIPACILYYIFRNFPISEVISIMTSSKIEYLLMGFVLFLVINLFSGYRLKIISENQDITITTFQAIEINLSKTFYGLFLPGGSLTGGTIRFYKLFGREKNIAGSLAAISLDGIISVIALCLVGVLMWLIHLPPNSGFLLSIISIILIASVLLILLLFQEKMTTLISKKIKSYNQPFLPLKFKQLISTLTQYKNLNLKCFTTTIALSIVTQFIGIAVYFFFAISLDIDISLIAMGWIRSIVVIATMLPISISGIGVREGVFLYLLNQYGVIGEQSLALSFLVFVVTILIIGLFGGLLEGRRSFLTPLRDT